MVDIDASVIYEGKKDKAEGSFGLVLWMDKFFPILLGRELLGAAKLMGEVPDAKLFNKQASFFAAEDGTRLLEAKLWDFKEKTQEEIAQMVKNSEGKCWLGWKHFPAVDLNGPDISYATYLPTENVIKQAWSAKGEFQFFKDIPWERAPLSSNVVNILSKLPILEYLDASAWIESSIYMPNKKLE